ncbi:MAG: hypothetical protein R3277_13695 [Brumimicrobium sp.]|nr:hypothetical protein [Brumimicrobium sp.]
MKKRLLLLFLVVCSTLLFSHVHSQNAHLGLWKGSNQGQVGYISLDSLGYAFFVIEGDTVGGKSFMLEGHEVSMKYKIKYNESHHHIDFIIYLKNQNIEISKLPGIFKFNDDQSILLCINFDSEDRPSDFNEEDILTLRKVN